MIYSTLIKYNLLFLLAICLAGCGGSAIMPDINDRYAEWEEKCSGYGYMRSDPLYRSCVELQEREHQKRIIPLL